MIEEKASNEYSDFGSSVGLAIKTGHDDSLSRAGLKLPLIDLAQKVQRDLEPHKCLRGPQRK